MIWRRVLWPPDMPLSWFIVSAVVVGYAILFVIILVLLLIGIRWAA